MKNERTAFTESKDTVVEKSDAEMHGHLGLHDDLPQGKEFPVVPPDGQIWVNKKLSKPRKKQVVKHERLENYLMRTRHMPYKKAHAIAEKWDKR